MNCRGSVWFEKCFKFLFPVSHLITKNCRLTFILFISLSQKFVQEVVKTSLRTWIKITVLLLKAKTANNKIYFQTKQTMIFLGLSILTGSTMVIVQRKGTYLDCQNIK